MSEDAKKTIETIQKGKLPPLNIPTPKDTIKTKGTQSSQRGLDRTTFGLQYLNENAHDSSNKNKGN